MLLARIAGLFGWSGRVGRREFGVLIAGPLTMLAALLWGFETFAPDGMPGWATIPGLAALMLPILFALGAVARRLHDVNLPVVAGYIFALGVRLSFLATAWATGRPHRDVFMLVALAGGLVWLGIWPGTPGENRFGPAPAGRGALPTGELSRSD